MEKGTAPPIDQGPSGSGSSRGPEAPPSYEQSVNHPQMGSGGNQKQPGAPTGCAQPPPAAGYAPPNIVPPPPPGIHPQVTPVVVQYVQAPNFGPHSINMVCPHCQSQIQTATSSEPGPMAWILAGILCIVGLWPCACIPCCIDQLNSVTHKCPQCNNFLGRYKGGL